MKHLLKNYRINLILISICLNSNFTSSVALSELSSLNIKLNSLNTNLNILKKQKTEANISPKENKAVIEISDLNLFNQYINFNKPCIIKFYTTLCAPCQELAPIFELLANKYSNLINFLAVNLSNKKLVAIAKIYKLEETPTLIFIKNNQVINKKIGFINQNDLENLITNFLGDSQKIPEPKLPAKPETLKDSNQKTNLKNTIEISSDNQLNQLINAKPSILKFYKTMCPPCKTMAPIFKTLAEKYSLKINFLEINADKSNLLPIAHKYGVTKLPTFVFIKNNQVIDKHIGSARPDYLKSLIENYLL